MTVDFLEGFLEALLRGAGHAAKGAVEILHRLDQIVVLAAKELQALLELAVLVVRHQVDGAHAFELCPELLVSRLDVLKIAG